MIIDMMPKGAELDDMPDYFRSEYGDMTDEEIRELRQKYKEYEKTIFARSWDVPSVTRFQKTCAAMCLALELATKTRDTRVIYCPWFYEAFNTLASRLIKEPKGEMTQKEWDEWARSTQETARGICTAMSCFGDYMVQYVRTVFPCPEKAPGGLIQAWRRIFAGYFNVKDSNDKQGFVRASFHLLLGYDSKHMPTVNTDVFSQVSECCLTMGWPRCCHTEEDNPYLISNPTNDEICQMLGVKLPTAEERDRIRRESEEAIMRVDLEDGEKESAQFFGDMSWMQKTNTEIGIWRITSAVCRIARKAVDFREFYYNKSREEPAFPISAEISNTSPDSFLPIFEAFTRHFCYEFPSLSRDSSKTSMLERGMMRLRGAVEAMFHYLNKLPHDRHLGVAKRMFDEWCDAFVHVVRGRLDIKIAAPMLAESVAIFKKELVAVGDVLNERENLVHDKYAFQDVAPTPKYDIEEEKLFESAKDINYIVYLERVMSACRDAYRQLGEDTSRWPRQMLPFAATMELLLIIDASERLKERLNGRDVPPSNFPSLHSMLDPRESQFLATMKRICVNFPSLTEDEYVEGLYEQLFSVGFMSEFYLGLSTSDDGLGIMPDYRNYWFHSFTQTFCSPKDKNKPTVSLKQTMASYEIIESCCNRLSREAKIQDSILSRKLYADGRLPPGNVRFDSIGAKGIADLPDGMIQSLAVRLAEVMKKNPIAARVVAFDAKAKHEITLAARLQPPERNYFSDPNLAVLFDVHPNSVANWRKGKGTPEGFSEALDKKDYELMNKCAERYKANRGRADAMNTKGVEHDISEEQIYKQGGNRSRGNCGSPQ